MTNPPDSDARTAPRRDASQVPEITSIRLSPHGVDATLVNISATGALIETTARVQPGASLTLSLGGGFRPALVRGRVVRSVIVAVGPGGSLRYQVGVAFNEEIELPPLAGAAAEIPLREPGASVEAIGVGNRW